jgi:hypothetical protein
LRKAIPFILGLPLLAAAGSAAAQVRAPEPQAYRFVTEIGGGSGLWVNPGGAGFNQMTRLLGNITFDRPEDGDWSTAQYMAGLQWKIAGFGYQHDDFAESEGGYAQGDSYVLAVGFASGRNGFGVSRTWRNVGPADGSFEIGWLSYGASGVSIGLVWRDIGSPVVRDSTLYEHVVGGVTFRPSETRFSFSLQGEYQTDGSDFRAFRIGGAVGLLQNLAVQALGEWNGEGDFKGFRLFMAMGHKLTVGTAGAGLDSGGDARTAHLGLSIDGPTSR